MAQYVYENQKGDRQEVTAPMSKPPKEVIAIDGVEFRRVYDAGLVQTKAVWKPYVSRRLPRNLEGFDTDKKGLTVINTQAQEAQAAAVMDWKRD